MGTGSYIHTSVVHQHVVITEPIHHTESCVAFVAVHGCFLSLVLWSPGCGIAHMAGNLLPPSAFKFSVAEIVPGKGILTLVGLVNISPPAKLCCGCAIPLQDLVGEVVDELTALGPPQGHDFPFLMNHMLKVLSNAMSTM